jgi:hypothetical protein
VTCFSSIEFKLYYEIDKITLLYIYFFWFRLIHPRCIYFFCRPKESILLTTIDGANQYFLLTSYKMIDQVNFPKVIGYVVPMVCFRISLQTPRVYSLFSYLS